MTRAVVISVVALFVSIASLGFSIYVALRNRGSIRTKSKFIQASDYGPARVAVTIVNAGRRR